jgi:hypothetical protein
MITFAVVTTHRLGEESQAFFQTFEKAKEEADKVPGSLVFELKGNEVKYVSSPPDIAPSAAVLEQQFEKNEQSMQDRTVELAAPGVLQVNSFAERLCKQFDDNITSNQTLARDFELTKGAEPEFSLAPTPTGHIWYNAQKSIDKMNEMIQARGYEDWKSLTTPAEPSTPEAKNEVYTGLDAEWIGNTRHWTAAEKMAATNAVKGMPAGSRSANETVPNEINEQALGNSTSDGRLGKQFDDKITKSLLAYQSAFDAIVEKTTEEEVRARVLEILKDRPTDEDVTRECQNLIHEMAKRRGYNETAAQQQHVLSSA